MGIWSIRLFRIFGIRLEVHLTFHLLWILFALFGWQQAGWSGVFWLSLFLFLIFVCVVLHELGHSLTARMYGINVSRILLLPIGGMAQFERIPRNPWQEIVISAAGPAVNFALAALLFLVLRSPEGIWVESYPMEWRGLLNALILLNLVMGVFNLLPIFPMDGGRIFRAALALRISYLKATSIAANVAKVLAITGILLALLKFEALLPAMLFAFIILGGHMEYKMVQRRENLSGVFVGDLTRKHYPTLESEQPMAEAARLFELFRYDEIMIMDHGSPWGYLPAKAVRRAIRKNLLDNPVRHHSQTKFSVLQSGWPLDPFVEMIAQNPQRLYPVYSFGNLIGVLDTKNIETLITSHRIRQRDLGRISAENDLIE